MAKVEIHLGQLTNTCFVIMPFSAVFDAEYSDVIRPAIEDAELSAVRADEIYSKPQVMADIWKSLKESRIVIAELSERNVNVFYEVGLAHALGKPVIILTRNEKDVPFDLKALRYVYYDTNNPSWGESLKKNLTKMIKGVIKEKDFGTVLTGVKSIGQAKNEYRKVPVSETLPPLYNLTGSWEGEMKLGRVKYDIKMDIETNGSELTGTIVVAFKQDRKIVLVQEAIKGIVVEDWVKIFGVSYTYLRQASNEDYQLDSFAGRITDNGNKIYGNCFDEDNEKGEFSISKV